MQEFIKTVNQLRLKNKNNWYTFRGIVENKVITIKGFNTWLQVYNVDGIRQNTCMDITVKEFKNTLREGLK